VLILRIAKDPRLCARVSPPDIRSASRQPRPRPRPPPLPRPSMLPCTVRLPASRSYGSYTADTNLSIWYILRAPFRNARGGIEASMKEAQENRD
jgi:hypothetical protein